MIPFEPRNAEKCRGERPAGAAVPRTIPHERDARAYIGQVLIADRAADVQ